MVSPVPALKSQRKGIELIVVGFVKYLVFVQLLLFHCYDRPFFTAGDFPHFLLREMACLKHASNSCLTPALPLRAGSPLE